MTSNAFVLTDPERVVLMIARQGERLAPVGFWKEAVLALYERGLLSKLDDFNYAITKDGRKAIDEDEDAEARQIIELNNQVAEAEARGEDVGRPKKDDDAPDA